MNPINQTFSNFRGLYDKDDSGLIPSNSDSGVFASQVLNIECTDGTITMGNGYEAENDDATTTTHMVTDVTFIRNEYKLEKRDGTIINVAQYNNGKLGWLNTVLNRYEILTIGLTTGVDVGMIDFNKTDQDRTYFGDGVNYLSYWNKAIGYYASDNGSTIITLTVPGGHTSLLAAGFAASGSVVFHDGTTITYSGLSGMTLTGCSAVPATPVVGDGIIQLPDKTTLTTQPVGRILFKFQGRLGVIPEASPTTCYMSKVADGTDFTTTGVEGRQILNIIDGDGRINAVLPFKRRLYFFKTGAIIPVLIEQLDSTTLRINIEPLIDSQDIGPESPGQVYSGLDEIYWVAPREKDVKTLSTIATDKEINSKANQISTPIQSTMDALDFTDSKLIVFKGDLYITAKSEGNYNTLVKFDSQKGTFYLKNFPARNFWVDSNNQLHFTDPYTIKSYRMSGFDADGGSIQYLWKSGRLNLGSNFYKKDLPLFAVFGRMTTPSEFTTQIDYNNGSLSSLDWKTKGDGSSNDSGAYMLNVDPSSSYGQNPYGILPYGGETTETNLQYFLMFKSLPKNFKPYDVFVSFAAEGENNHIKIISFGLVTNIRPEISKKRRI